MSPGAHQPTALPASELESRAVPVADLRPFSGNPRRGSVRAIRESLERNGQYRPVVVNRPTMEVLAGNHTLYAARELGWERIAATFVEVDAEQARRIVLVDNRTNDLASYDEGLLAELLQELPDLAGTGYDMASVDALLNRLGRPTDRGEDIAPPLPAKPRTQPGEVIELGRHRLVCGDATDPGAWDALLGSERPELAWTDPPYGVSYSGKTDRQLTIRNDGAEGLAALLQGAFGCLDEALSPGAAIYIAHPAGALSLIFGSAFSAQGWRLHQTLVWVKDAMVLGHADYHYRHEPILYGYKPAHGRRGRGAGGWYGDNAQVSVLEVDRPRASAEHPTMKPPALIEIALGNSSQSGDLVLDPFAGSGSTLVACERMGRGARLLELDPAYCDVIVERFERLTAIKGHRSIA